MADTSSPITVRPRCWRDLRWILAAVITLVIGMLLVGLFGPERPLRVSRETTHITAPLAADGLPDYLAHALSLYGPPPPPEQNAAVPLLRATWPMEFEPADLPVVCKALGIPATPPTDPPPLVRVENDPLLKPVSERYDECQTRPWRSSDQPEIKAWLDRNQHAIDLIVTASSRDRYWLPSPTLLASPPSGMLIGVLLPDVQTFRLWSRVLCCRAMGHAGEGRFDEAWRDVLAVHRLSRLLSGEPGFLVTHLVAIAVAAQAQMVTLELLGLPGLTVADVQRMRHDLEALRPLPKPAYGLPVERLMGIDCVVTLARRPGDRWHMIDLLDAGGSPGGLGIPWLVTSLDWNLIASRFNGYYDQVTPIAALPTHQERVDRMGKMAADVQGRVKPSSGWQLVGRWLSGAVNRGERSVQTADMLLSLLAPALSAYDAAVARGEAQLSLLRLAVALEEKRLAGPVAGGGYPERLDALVLTLLAELPPDPFTGRPFVCERRGDGYLLYSVGQNGVDDGGTDVTGWIVKGEWQEKRASVDSDKSDIVVRMPIPARK
jgi:hypothetical protein